MYTIMQFKNELQDIIGASLSEPHIDTMAHAAGNESICHGVAFVLFNVPENYETPILARAHKVIGAWFQTRYLAFWQ